MADTTSSPIPTATAVTPGWKTTEFWLKLAAMLLTTLFAAGVIPTSGPVATVAAIAATMLGSLGYTVARSFVKSGAAPALSALLLGSLVFSQAACGPAKAGGREVLGAVVDCTASDRAKLEAQFGPTVEQALLRALGQDGKIDLPSLTQIGSALETDGWCVLEREAAKLIAWLATKAGTASAAAPLDVADLRSKLTQLRTQKFGATQFQLGPAGPPL